MGTKTAGRVFYSETQTDTDFIVSPTATGTEFSWLLRSPDAPQRLILNVDLPAGAAIRRVRTDKPIAGDPPKSLEIVAGGDVIAYVRPPIVYDADGVSVASEMTVEGRDKIVITAEHRDQDLRYPLNADPVVELQSNQWAPWYGWSYAQAPSNGYPGVNYYGFALQNCNYNCSGPYISMPTNTWFSGSGTAGGYSFRPPANSYINRVQLAGLAHTPLVPNATLSQFYDGILNPAGTAWQPGVTWSFSTVAPAVNPYLSGNNPFGPWAGGISQPGVYQDVCCDTTDGNWFNISLQAAYSSAFYTYGYSANLSLAGAGIYLGDKHPPIWNSVKPPDKDWTDDTDNRTHTPGLVAARDDGLGLTGITLSGAASGNGTLGAPCTGRAPSAPCDLNITTNGFTYQLDEGINSNLALRATDAVGQSVTHTWTEKIDRSKPQITSLSGTLYSDRVETHPEGMGLYRPLEQLDVTATDNASGIKSVRLLSDGQPITGVPASTPTCGTECPTSYTASFDVSPAALGPGSHTIIVEVDDQIASHTTTSTINVFVPDDNPIRIDEDDDGEPTTLTDVDDNTACPADPDYPNSSTYCEPDETNPLTQELWNEPGVDDAATSLLRMGTLPAGSPSTASPASAATSLDPTMSCEMFNPINGAMTGSGGRYGLSDQNAYGGGALPSARTHFRTLGQQLSGSSTCG